MEAEVSHRGDEGAKFWGSAVMGVWITRESVCGGRDGVCLKGLSYELLCMAVRHGIKLK